MKSFNLDQEQGCLTFTDEVGNQLACKVQIVGTYSNESGTWLWAWNSPWVVGELSADSKRAREYGTQHGFDKLTTPKWRADESDGWAMTAITAKLTSAEGAYRLPNRQSLIFMLIKNVQSLPKRG
jgi:hypothetical protein